MTAGARTAAAATLLPTLLLSACGTGEAGDDGTATLTVFAASSLTTTFEELGRRFEADHAGVTVEFSFAGSSDLVAQIQQGAPADVFASADEANMEKLSADGLNASEPVPFASNTLEIAVPPGNPDRVRTLRDLATGLDVVVCAPEVPCGAAAQSVAETAGVELRPVSEEQSVTDVLNKVAVGEADAGLVYVTDVAAADGAVDGVPFAEAGSAVNVYPITTLADSEQRGLGREFVDLVVSPEGMAVLAEAGFGEP